MMLINGATEGAIEGANKVKGSTAAEGIDPVSDHVGTKSAPS